jgi:glycosyltransferase involved in cell wall biosynthesis
MKLIIQIPCYNEEKSLPLTLRHLPRELDHIDTVEWLIVDDGSTDDTVRVAHDNGVDHVVELHHNQGLSKAFMAGLDACLRRGADIIVNTDADNQYDARDIPALIQPILDGKAEIVIGDRAVSGIPHFSPVKKVLQRIGSFVVRKLSKTSVMDAPSGFRAIHRRAAMQLNVFNEYSYTIETIIQAGHKNIVVASVPVRTNPDLRPSRLVKSIRSYVVQMLMVMCRIFITYRPLRFFFTVGTLIMLPGIALGLRYLWIMANGLGFGNIQSLILAAVFLLAGFFVILCGFLADLISVNRKLLEEVRTRTILLEYHFFGESFPSERSKYSGLPLDNGTLDGKTKPPMPLSHVQLADVTESQL